MKIESIRDLEDATSGTAYSVWEWGRWIVIEIGNKRWMLQNKGGVTLKNATKDGKTKEKANISG